MQYKTVVPEEKETHEMIVLVVDLEARSTAHNGKPETKKSIAASLVVTIEAWSGRSEFGSAGVARVEEDPVTAYGHLHGPRRDLLHL